MVAIAVGWKDGVYLVLVKKGKEGKEGGRKE